MPIYANGRDTSLRNLGRGPGSGDVASKALTIENVVAGAKRHFFTENGVNLSRVVAAVRGTNPQVTWNLHFGPNLDSLGTKVFDVDKQSDQNGSDDIMFSNAQVPSNSFVCLNVIAVSGTVDELAVTFIPELV